MNRTTKCGIRVLLLMLLLLRAASAFAQGTFSSGSSGAQGVFPPAAFANATYGAVVVDLKTGTVSGLDISGNAVTVALSGGTASGDAFATGELNFTSFTVPSGKTLTFVKNTFNTPITVLTSGDATIAGTIDIRGGDGTSGNFSGLSPGGRGGPGGFDGGHGGAPAIAGRAATAGGPGLGAKGGTPGLPGVLNGKDGLGGNFPHSNPRLLPLTGGSGGGGGAGGVTDGPSGNGGGGGGGAILIAASGKITVSGSILANGGDAGVYSFYENGSAGSGSGGGIRLIANRIEINGGTLNGKGGTRGFAGGPGIISLEAYDYVTTGINTNPPPSLAQPSTVQPVNLPRLRISSVGGVTVPDITASAGIVDIALPTGSSAPSNPMPIVVSASNIPTGTNITVSVKTSQGAESTATAALANGTASVNLTVPGGISFIQAFTAVFTVSAELQRDLPLFNGEKILQASVEFDGSREHAYFFTKSGRRVTAEQLFSQP